MIPYHPIKSISVWDIIIIIPLYYLNISLFYPVMYLIEVSILISHCTSNIMISLHQIYLVYNLWDILWVILPPLLQRTRSRCRCKSGTGAPPISDAGAANDGSWCNCGDRRPHAARHNSRSLSRTLEVWCEMEFHVTLQELISEISLVVRGP